MIFPSKLFTYKESILSKLPIALAELEKEPISPKDLYKSLHSEISGVAEYMDLLDCLYALNKIAYDEEQEVLVYVR